MGTNPFAYAIPAGRYPAVVLDVATTTGAALEVRLAAQRNHPVPEGMILDGEGRPTTDPNEFIHGGLMAPLGSPTAPHKGFGLGLLFDTLAGVLTGAAFARDFPREPATAGNAFFWALDVEAFLPREEFLGRMEAQIDQVVSRSPYLRVGPERANPRLPRKKQHVAESGVATARCEEKEEDPWKRRSPTNETRRWPARNSPSCSTTPRPGGRQRH